MHSDEEFEAIREREAQAAENQVLPQVQAAEIKAQVDRDKMQTQAQIEMAKLQNELQVEDKRTERNLQDVSVDEFKTLLADQANREKLVQDNQAMVEKNKVDIAKFVADAKAKNCLLYTSPSPRD